MSRRKQSNPKSLKSDMEESSSAATDMTKKDENWENHETRSDNLKIHCDSDQSETEEIVTSSPQQVSDIEGSPVTSRGHSDKFLSTAALVSIPSSDRASKSLGELPRVSDSPQLASALKGEGCCGSLYQLPGATLTQSGMKEELKSSPPRSPLVASVLCNSSLTDGLSTTTLSKVVTDANSNHLSSMIQGIPLLSSVLPALQRLAPVSLASISPAPSSNSGIVCICGVKFNGSSNLEAHKMFYCSQRPGSSSERKEGSHSPPKEGDEEGLNAPMRLLRCPHCPYTTSHKLSLNGHMNIHTNPEEASSNLKPSAFSPTIDLRASERYCTDCDIQFSSMKTFRVHKTHYCQTRHVLKGSKSPVREDIATVHHTLSSLGVIPVSTSGIGGGQPVLALPTNPVLLVPYSLVAGAQLLPPQVLPQLGAAFVLPNGQVHPLPTAGSGSSTGILPMLSPGALAAAATAAVAMAETANAAAAMAETSSSSISPQCKSDKDSSSSQRTAAREELSKETDSPGKRRGDSDFPLDLTTKRPKLSIKTDLLNDDEKENREMNGPVPNASPIAKISCFSTGEFEGKLLASPPHASPSEDNEERSSQKSPTQLSLTPNQASPKGSNDSSRPSTSTASNSTRSGHTSPVTSSAGPSLPTLPLGFPNSLVTGLEALGSALPLAGLQCLQSLQNVPRDIAMKLINPDLLMNGLSPVLNPPVIVKQGEAKCNECNIVFYKEESLQIHKKHYCSARETNKSPDEEQNSSGNRSPIAATSQESTTTPHRSPVRDTNSAASSSSSQKDGSKTSSKTLLQFICTACGIKFTSPDNLTAHQTYYCSKQEGVAEEGVTKGLWRCPRCRVVMTETMQAAHQCVSPTPAPSHGWKCPCCPVLSPTAAAAQKHLETHAGIKAFRCTICGYRGNTLRGMRTHIRMHFEKRTSDLQEENFIACILEDEEPRSRNNMSAESRKLLDSSRLLLENSTLSALLADGGITDRVEPPLTCAYCPFITPLRTSLVQHLTVVHKIGVNLKLSQELQKTLMDSRSKTDNGATSSRETKKEQTEDSKREHSPPVAPIKLEPEVKLEVHEDRFSCSPPATITEADRRSPATSLSNGSSGKNYVCYCQACNISFALLDSYVAHKRFYCSRPESSTPPETTVQ